MKSENQASAIVYRHHKYDITGISAILPYWNTKNTLEYVLRNYGDNTLWKPHLVVRIKCWKNKR